MNQNYIVIIIISLFTFIPLLIGTKASNSSLFTIEDFFLQSRKMGTVPAFFTVSATWWSSFAFLGSSAYFYVKGPVYWTGIAWNILFGILFYAFGKRIWQYGHDYKLITPSNFFEHIFSSKRLSVLITLVMLVFTLPYLQIQLLGGAYLIDIASNGLIPWRVGGLVFYLIIVIYLWAGGLRAVAWADIFFGILIYTGMLLGGILLVRLVGGIDYLFYNLQISHNEYLTLPGPLKDAGELTWISMFLITPIGALMGPQMWIRMYAIKDKRTFNLMPFLLSVSAIIYIGSMLSGYVGLLLEPVVERPDMIFPIMIMKYMKLPVAVFLLCCGSAAALSTANSQIHAISCVFSVDIYKRFINQSVNERQLVQIGKWAIVFFSLIAYVMLISFPGLLVNIGLIALGGLAQVFIPVCGFFIIKNRDKDAAFWGIITGLVSMVVFTFYIQYDLEVHVGILALLLNIFVYLSIILCKRIINQLLMKQGIKKAS